MGEFTEEQMQQGKQCQGNLHFTCRSTRRHPAPAAPRPAPPGLTLATLSGCGDNGGRGWGCTTPAGGDKQDWAKDVRGRDSGGAGLLHCLHGVLGGG